MLGITTALAHRYMLSEPRPFQIARTLLAWPGKHRSTQIASYLCRPFPSASPPGHEEFYNTSRPSPATRFCPILTQDQILQLLNSNDCRSSSTAGFRYALRISTYLPTLNASVQTWYLSQESIHDLKPCMLVSNATFHVFFVHSPWYQARYRVQRHWDPW